MRDRGARVALTVMAIGSGLVGVWAAFFPRGFYDDFPGLGHHWLALDGPFNEHLARDVGELSLALTLLAVVAAVSLARPLVRATAAAFLVDGALHLAYHLRHLHAFPSGDRVAGVVSLLVGPVAALVALWCTRPIELEPAAGNGATMPASEGRLSLPSSTSASTGLTDR